MNPGALAVRPVEPADEARWRELWRDYLLFYAQALPEHVTDHTWTRILDPRAPIFAQVAVHEGEVAGFAVAVVHEGTWTLTPICYLEDLFVAPHVRGRGVGRALIDDLKARAEARGWSRLYWHTGVDNHRARALYDRYVAADAVVRYQVALA